MFAPLRSQKSLRKHKDPITGNSFIESRLNHILNLKIINLKDQISFDSGRVPFKKGKKTLSTLIMLTELLLLKKAKIIRVFTHYAKNYASIIYKGLTTSEHGYAYHG